MKKVLHEKDLIEEQKTILQVEKENKIYSQTFFLSDKNTIVKPTYVNEIDTIINIFGEFTIFGKKTRKKAKNTFSKGEIISLVEKTISMTVKKLNGKTPKFLADIRPKNVSEKVKRNL